MKHIQTFESFLNEAAKNDNVITFKKFKDIDHTRLVKWMQNEFGNKYNPGMKWLGGHLVNGGDFELDVTDWDKRDLADLKKYLKSQSYISEGIVNEGAVKQFEVDYANLVKNLKSGYGWIDPDFVEETWDNTGNSIEFSLVADEVLNRLIKADLLYFADAKDEEVKGKKVTNISQLK